MTMKKGSINCYYLSQTAAALILSTAAASKLAKDDLGNHLQSDSSPKFPALLNVCSSKIIYHVLL